MIDSLFNNTLLQGAVFGGLKIRHRASVIRITGKDRNYDVSFLYLFLVVIGNIMAQPLIHLISRILCLT